MSGFQLAIGQEVFVCRSRFSQRIVKGHVVAICFPVFSNLTQYNKAVVETNWLGIKRHRLVELGDLAIAANDGQAKEGEQS